ncbi:hypothetical protein [Sporosarcina koreensis]|uniref:Uncharacterized protein n=1 Tax=Sporosarcina koreensis TaxID=334735 RepID=A0ABW0TYT0_9BACL
MDTTKGKFVLFFWAVLLFLFYFKIFAFVWDRWIYESIIPDLFGILGIILIVIPAAFLTARLLVLKIPMPFHMIGIIGVVLLFSWNVYDDHREKGLDELFIYQASNYNALVFMFPDWRTEEMEPVEELMEFLSQYRVKKMSDSEWDAEWDRNVTGEKGFSFMIYSNDKGTGASIYKNRLMSYNNPSYYKVLNGPIDMKWVEMFKEKHMSGQ